MWAPICTLVLSPANVEGRSVMKYYFPLFSWISSLIRSEQFLRDAALTFSFSYLNIRLHTPQICVGI